MPYLEGNTFMSARTANFLSRGLIVILYMAAAVLLSGLSMGADGTPTRTLITSEIAVEQPAGTGLVDGTGSSSFGSVNVGANSSLSFIIKNTGTAVLTGLGI